MSAAVDSRRFLGWNEPALPTAAALLADAHARGDAIDLSACTVALPGARAGRRLKELLVEVAEQRALRLIPPRVVTIGALPEQLYAQQAPLLDRTLARRLWARVLRTLPTADRVLLFPNEPAPEDLRGWLALAATVEKLHEDVAGAGLRFADVAARCAGDLLFDDGARWRVLAGLQERYATAVARAGRADPQLARLTALETNAVVCDDELWLIGLAEMPGTLRRMIAALLQRDAAARVHVLVHAPEARADDFDDIGCVRPDVWAAAHIPLPDGQLAIVGHPSNQAVAAAHAIALFGGAYAADEIVIGVPDGEVVPYVEQQLEAAGVPSRYAGGSPLEASAPFLLLHAIAELLASDSPEAFAALVRHPDLGRWLVARVRRVRAEDTADVFGAAGEGPDATATEGADSTAADDGADADRGTAGPLRELDGWLAPLDAYLTKHLPARVTHASDDSTRGWIVQALRRALYSKSLLRELRGRAPVAHWMAAAMDLLVEIYGAHRLNRDIPRDRDLLAALRQFKEAAAAHHRIAERHDEQCDVATAFRILLEDVRGGRIPAESLEAAVEMAGWLELHLDDAPAAVLTGMNEPFVPEAVNADPFLPNALRALLGMEDNARRYARDAYQLTAMLHARRHMHVIAGRRTVDGDPLRPSRLLLALEGRALAERVRKFLGDEGAGTAAVVVNGAGASGGAREPAGADDAARSPLTPPAQSSSRFQLPPKQVIRLESVPDTLSVTDFRTLLTDPYGFALGAEIGRDPVHDAEREMDPLRFGGLAHEVLERFGHSDAAVSSDASAVAAVLNALLDATVAERFGADALPAARLQVEQLRLRLGAFAVWQAQWIADGWRIVAVEARTEDDGVPFDVDGQPFRVRGRIDRIDYHAGRGEWAVFDYKSGERAPNAEDSHRRKDGTWIDLQLPLYHFLLPTLRTDDGTPVFDGSANDPVRLGYIALCGDPAAIGESLVSWSAAELEDAMNAARAVVRVLRANRFDFPGLGSRRIWDDDLAALLGVGRLVAPDDDEVDDEEVLA